MPRLNSRVPRYRLHKASGQAVVWIDGRDVYLGQHGSDESRKAYARLIGMWQLRQADSTHIAPRDDLTINELFLAYWQHARSHYVKDGQPTSEQSGIRSAVRQLLARYGTEYVALFGPRDLRTVREAMIEEGASRNTINHHVSRIRRIFRWGVANDLVPAEVHQRLQTLDGLQRGRSAAKESKPVKPADPKIIEGAVRAAPRQIAAMIRLQLYSGMRPGEVRTLRPRDVERSGEVWIYTPASHKTEHHGRARTVFLGPRAQEILAPFLVRHDDKPCFSPVEAETERRQTLSAQRTTPLSCGNRPGTNRKASPKRKISDAYTTASYRQAIAYACKKAFPAPAGLSAEKRKKWEQEHRFHPHQLRHNAATEITREFGIEAAQVVLGHSTLAVTQVYAERDMRKAAEIMRRVG